MKIQRTKEGLWVVSYQNFTLTAPYKDVIQALNYYWATLDTGETKKLSVTCEC